MKSDLILKKIHDLKHAPLGSAIVSGTYNKTLYRLLLLTDQSTSRWDIIELLASWRKMHESWFPQQFPITKERTQIWLKNKVIEEKDRLLFMIEKDGHFIGHVGLYRFNFAEDTCEIDNIVRGVEGFPGLIEQSIKDMMVWGRQELNLKHYTLETTSDNARAIRLYTRMGFREEKRIPMIYKITTDGGAWEEAPKEYTGEIVRYTVYMKQYETK